MNTTNQERQNLSKFGKRVAEIRKHESLTQEQLAERAGMATDSIAAIEQGRRWLV